MKRNIVIIGGSSGIGSAIVNEFLSNGDKVYNFSRSEPQISHENFMHRTLDVLNFDKQVFEEVNNIEAVFYCPGTIRLKPFKSLKEKDLLEDLKINTIGAFDVIQVLLSKIREGGSVLLFSSIAAQTGLKYHTSVSVAKGALEGMVKALSAELAPKVRVNAFALSLTVTPLAEKLTNSEEKVKKAEQRHPLQKIGDPKQIAKMAKHFSSNEASWITGEVLKIDGGLSTIKDL